VATGPRLADDTGEMSSPDHAEEQQPAVDADAGLVTENDRVAAEAPVMVSRWAIHRRLYDWVLAFAHRRHATTALFVLSFVESSFFPIPPDVLLAPMCLGNRRRAMWFAIVTTIGSVLGAFLGYFIGRVLTPLGEWLVGAANITALAAEFDSRGEVWVFIAALTPIPFKLLTITAGVAGMNLILFAAACAVGRAVRFCGVAGVFWLVGPRALPFIDRYFNLLCVVFTVLLVGGFLVLKALH
jgi:membrane protein YqaA with SNARE-associated domain